MVGIFALNYKNSFIATTYLTLKIHIRLKKLMQTLFFLLIFSYVFLCLILPFKEFLHFLKKL